MLRRVPRQNGAGSAITIDWVVLMAAVLGLGVACYTSLVGSGTAPQDDAIQQVQTVNVNEI